MTQQATGRMKYTYGVKKCESFPILYEDSLVQIYKNPSGEIFIEDVRSGMTMRISPYTKECSGLQFTTDGRVEPIQIANMIGWRIVPRWVR